MTEPAFTISVEALFAIEDALQNPEFLGTPIGTTLNDWLVTKLFNGNRDWGWKPVAKDHLRYLFHRFKSPCSGSRDFTHLKGKLCLTWLFDRFDLKSFVLPIIDVYGSERVFVVGPERSMAAQLPPGTEFVAWREMPTIDMGSWRRQFDACASKWRRQVSDRLQLLQVKEPVIANLMDTVQLQTQRLIAFRSFLDQASPCAIVTEYDRNTHASGLLLAAKERGIPSWTMIHGALDPYPSYGFVPLLADYACCWGERHRQQMLELGAKPETLLVTGCQRLTRKLSANKQDVLIKSGLPSDTPVVMLITNPINPEHKKAFASAFCTAMNRVDQVTPVVRVHPAEQLQEYQELIDQFPAIRFVENGTWSQDEALAVADIVVNHDSSFGNDALVKGRLVVVLDVLPTPLKNGKELIEMAGCPWARSVDDLQKIIESMITQRSLRNELHEKAEHYVSQYCHAFAADAALNIVKAITDVTSVAAFQQSNTDKGK